MKKFFTLAILLTLSLTISAQQHGAAGMRFAGKANFSVPAGVSVDVASDTVSYIGAGSTASFVIPSMSYNMGMQTMKIPSFQIDNTTFTGGYGGVTWPEQTFSTTTADGKTITGTSLTGAFTHGDGVYNLKLTITFIYGVMPMPITYTIDGYYVKETTDKLDVVIGGNFSYSAPSVTYSTRLYKDGEETKMDVQVPSYTLEGTMIGDLTIGGYTVQGLAMDAEKGGYYRDYSKDGLTMYFSNGAAITGDYPLNNEVENILVKMNERGTAIASVVNNFKPGKMPFEITSTFPGTTSGVKSVKADAGKSANANGAAYNMAGQQVGENTKGIVIVNGKKYWNR